MEYLTNTKLENKAAVEYAAKKSGMNVEFSEYPMPIDDSSHSMYYDPEQLVGVYGSVISHEGYVDHGPFWRAWDEFDATPSPASL